MGDFLSLKERAFDLFHPSLVQLDSEDKNHLVRQLDVVHPQPGPGTSSYLGCDRILVFLQIRNSFSNPHVNGPYYSVYVVRSIDPISHSDQGI